MRAVPAPRNHLIAPGPRLRGGAQAPLASSRAPA